MVEATGCLTLEIHKRSREADDIIHIKEELSVKYEIRANSQSL